MKRNEFNAVFREYVRTHLSPTPAERKTVSDIYQAIQDVLGAANCIQIGSYPRFTAVSPVHDLDVLYVLGTWDINMHDPRVALSRLHQMLRTGFKNPTNWQLKITLQTHSINIQFLDGEEEKLSVDIVPAFTQGTNEFGQDTYFVPELVRRGHAARLREYRELREAHREMQWIKTDPRGYIEVARRTDAANNDFRKSVKFIKGWHYSCKKAFDSKLKSFHIEQIVTGYFRDGQPDIFDAVFRFFYELPDALRQPRIPDRADPTRCIDEYIGRLGFPEKRAIQEARDGFLIKLEEFEPGDDVSSLLAAHQRERKSSTESYLFDQGIPTLTDRSIEIVGEVQPRTGGFRGFILDKLGIIDIDRKISFRLKRVLPEISLYKWKVKNDDTSTEPRGEITDRTTRNDPESTKYNGSHYVECYGIEHGICVAKARQDVKLVRRV